ncbi:MAG: hypothetical protein WBQ44_13030 [Rhodococcus sp. (in: high G+C Gram-positive bacteria)]
MPMYQLRTDDDEVLAEAELPTDSKAMTWAVRRATELRKILGGRRWEGYRLVGETWEHRFAGGCRSAVHDPLAS